MCPPMQFRALVYQTTKYIIVAIIVSSRLFDDELYWLQI